MPKLYNELAEWWPLLSPPDDYQEEADFFGKVLLESGLPSAPTLLELGSGGGNNAFHLKTLFAQVTLTDLSPQMLAISRTLNPECTHLEGDMRTLRLGSTFDAVFIHDAIDYMTTLTDLHQALKTAFIHCKAGGVALLVPDDVLETFQATTEHGGIDGQDRGLRYLEWSYDPDETDTEYTVEYVYLMREGPEIVGVEHERHICGIFPRAEWLHLLREVGFQAKIVQDPYKRDIFVANKPNV